MQPCRLTAYCHDHLTRSDGSCQHCRTGGTPKVYFSHAGSLGARVVRLQSPTLPHGGFCPTKCGRNVSFLHGGEIRRWEYPPSRQRTVREAQNYGLMKDTKRTASGAIPLRRAKYPRLRGLLRRASRAFKIVAESGQPARLFASFSTFFFQTKKKVIVPPSKGIFVILL